MTIVSSQLKKEIKLISCLKVHLENLEYPRSLLIFITWKLKLRI